MSTPALVALRYMTRFRCTGGECIDTCCQGWDVLVDEPHYVQLRKKLATTPEATAAFDAAVPLQPAAARTPGRHATFRMEGGACCAFLDAERWCGLQRAHGEEILPDICVLYPRVATVLGERIALVGHLSCPEVARLLLFEEDATDLVPVDAALLGPRRRALPAAAHAGAAAAMVDELRAALHAVMGEARGSVERRLFTVAAAALHAAPILAKPRIDLGALGDLLGVLQAPVARALLDDAAERTISASAAALDTVLRVATPPRSDGSGHGRYDAVLAALHESLRVRGEGAVDDAGALSAARLLPVFVRRRAALRAAFAPLLDVAARGFARHALAALPPGVPPADFPSVVLALVGRLALQSLLLAFHPRVDDVLAARDEAALRALLVEGHYAVARALEHNAAFAASFRKGVAARVKSLADAGALLALA